MKGMFLYATNWKCLYIVPEESQAEIARWSCGSCIPTHLSFANGENGFGKAAGKTNSTVTVKLKEK